MSFLSFFKKNKSEKIELNKKKLIKNEAANLGSEFKIDVNELKDNIDISKLVKIDDKYLIAKICSIIPEVAELLIKDNKKFNIKLPAVGGNLDEALKKGNPSISKEVLDNIKFNGDDVVAKEVASYLIKNVKHFKGNKPITANALIISAEIISKQIVDDVSKSLDEISYEVKEIRNFLNNEYKSKIEEASLFLEKTITFKDELIKNDDRRKEKISQIENHISSCIQLIKQAIITINASTKEIRDNYNKYEKAIYELEDWLANLRTLYGLISELCRVDYLFYQGGASLESCVYDLKLLKPEIKECILGINNWHQIEQLKLEVNIETGEHKNTGIKTIIKKFLAKQENQRSIEYSKIEDDVMMMIEKHMNMSIDQFELYENELFNNDINLAIVNGDIYYYNNIIS